MKILKVEVGKTPYVKEIKNSIAAFQDEINGIIATVGIDECALVLNSDAVFYGLLPNRIIDKTVIYGDFFIIAEDKNKDFISLTDTQIKRYEQELKKPINIKESARRW